MLDSTAFDPYDAPCNLFLKDGEFLELNWQRRDRANGSISTCTTAITRTGSNWISAEGDGGAYCDRVTFVLPIPDETAEFQDASGEFHPLAELSGLPEAIRWRRGNPVPA